MKEEMKRRIAEAFDRGELSGTSPPGDAAEAAYFKQLSRVERNLRRPPAVSIPADFVRMVMSRLPESGGVLRRAWYFRNLLAPLFLVLVLAASVVFADFFGVAPLMNSLGGQMNQAGEDSLKISFIAVTGAGILFSSWFIINSFFGIRSRRVERR